jgi:stage II sporulation protein D
MLRRKSRKYHLSADTYSQVYRGREAENWRTSRAVDDTRGMVLEYNGKVVPGYFSSCCGGHTQDASVVWGEESIPPLEGVRCGWCWMSPYYRWEVRVSAENILKGLREAGYEIDRIRDIRPLETDDSGRLVSLRVSSGDKEITVPVTDMRRAVGTNRMKSTAFSVRRYPRFFLFRGKGWGHGVGMCQWGAFGLALRWKKSGWILRYYYPGADIVDMAEIIGKK